MHRITMLLALFVVALSGCGTGEEYEYIVTPGGAIAEATPESLGMVETNTPVKMTTIDVSAQRVITVKCYDDGGCTCSGGTRAECHFICAACPGRE
jgi:hypothetical protein